MLHKTTKPRLWRGGAQVIEDLFEYAQPVQRVEVKRQEQKEHLQADTPQQVLEDKPWENEALQDLELALPPMRTEVFKRAASSYKARWFSFKGAFGCQLGKVRYNCGFLAKVEQCGHFPVQTSKLFISLIPKNATSERPIALFIYLIRWWAWLRSRLRVGCYRRKQWWCRKKKLGRHYWKWKSLTPTWKRSIKVRRRWWLTLQKLPRRCSYK